MDGALFCLLLGEFLRTREHQVCHAEYYDDLVAEEYPSVIADWIREVVTTGTSWGLVLNAAKSQSISEVRLPDDLRAMKSILKAR